MLTKMIGRTGEVREGNAVYAYVNECDGDQERQQTDSADRKRAAAER